MSDPEEPRGTDFWLAPFFRDPTLWPITAVVLLIALVFGAAGVLLALEGQIFAIAALLIAFWISVDVAVRQTTRGVLLGVAVYWSLAVAAALTLHRLDWF